MYLFTNFLNSSVVFIVSTPTANQLPKYELDWAEPILTACYCKTFKNILYICDFIFDLFDIPGQKDKKNTFEFKLLKLSETLKPFTNIISTQKLLNHISPCRKTPLPLKLETKVFTITDKVPTRAFSLLKALSHL